MKYLNKKTGFVFNSDSECVGEDWVEVQSSPEAPDTVQTLVKEPVQEDKKEEKPKRAKKGNAK